MRRRATAVNNPARDRDVVAQIRHKRRSGLVNSTRSVSVFLPRATFEDFQLDRIDSWVDTCSDIRDSISRLFWRSRKSGEGAPRT